MYRAVNQVRLSLIRIEADETTYNLHIALRFELELAMVEGRLAVADLPDAWDEATHRLLGLETPSVMEGVLQDIHWGAGMIGYFPTYTIGNLMAAQLWRALVDDLPDIDGPDRERGLRAAARVAAREHPPPRPQVRLARAAPPGDGRGAQRGAVARLSRGQAARRRIADRARARSPLVANVCSTKPSGAPHRMEGGLMSSRQNSIVVTGAREHNLKDVTVTLPRDSLVVITGLSGSGKSSLAFDTIYAEGQRRYVESLSAYARQFLGQMDKPDVDSIEGLSPAISIDQKTTSRNPRSTVGTVTEIYDYLRLLWARIGKPHCFNCGRPIAAQSAEQIIDQIMGMEEGTRFMVMAPIVRGRKGEYGKQLQELRSEGFTRVKVDGELRTLEEDIVLDKKYKHDISVVVDRLVMRHGSAQAAGRFGGDGGRSGRRHHRGRDRATRGWGRGLYVQRTLCVPSLRHFDAGAGAAVVLVQRAARRLPALHRAGLDDGDRSGARGAGSVADDQRGRDPAVVLGGDVVLRADRAGDRRALPGGRGLAVGGPAGGGPEPLPVRHQRRQAVRLATATGWGASGRT